MRDNLQVYTDKIEPRSVGIISSDIIDFGVGTDYGKTDGQNVWQVRVIEAFAGGGEVKISLQHSDDGVNYSSLIAKEFSATTLKAGTMAICQPIPVGFKRFSKTEVEVIDSGFTAGAITSWLGTREEI